MFRDNTLIPTETIRLLALGLLAECPRSYSELASEVQAFTARLAGPSLDLVGPPLELLRVVELVQPSSPEADGALAVTDAGRSELERLLCSNVRPPTNDASRLALALKLRFLHHLPRNRRQLQAEILAEVSEREVVRLSDLRDRQEAGAGPFEAWLELSIRQAEERRRFFLDLLEKTCAAPVDH